MAFREDIGVFVKSLDQQASLAIAETARAVDAEIKADQATRRGIAPSSDALVDGAQGPAFESVKPNGVIFIAYDYRAEIVRALFAELVARSPIGPPERGHYRDAHLCLLDGRALAPLTVPSPEAVAAVNEVTVTNPMPYASKIEAGRQGTDPHIYKSALAPVRREFSGVAKFRLTTAFLDGYRHPAIVVTVP